MTSEELLSVELCQVTFFSWCHLDDEKNLFWNKEEPKRKNEVLSLRAILSRTVDGPQYCGRLCKRPEFDSDKLTILIGLTSLLLKKYKEMLVNHSANAFKNTKDSYTCKKLPNLFMCTFPYSSDFMLKQLLRLTRSEATLARATDPNFVKLFLNRICIKWEISCVLFSLLKRDFLMWENWG